MEDNFKTYDKNPIVGVIQISKWSFGLREIILAIIAGLLLLMVLIFAGLFGNAEQKLADTSPVSAAAIVGNSFCVEKGCLETSARSLDFMNKTVNPCENFYQYSCGNYKRARPLGPNRGTRTMYHDLNEANEDKLVEIMEKPVDRFTDWSAQRKLKEFFQSCNDLYQRESLRGKPFLEKVVPALGGWDLLGTWNADSWDLNTMLKKVQGDFLVDALYQARVITELNNKQRRTVQLWPAGLGKWMYSSWYLSPYREQYRTDYKKFIRRVGSLLLRDSGVVLDDTTKNLRLDQFVNDTYEIEYHIARVGQNSRYDPNPFEEENKVALSQLTSETTAIDWTAQLSYLFDGAGLTRNTKVVLMRREYYRNITATISSIPEQDRKRMLHHYLIWRVAEIYVQDLSWEYIHANRDIYVDTRGRTNFAGVYRYCFSTIQSYMPDALSALFISDHFSDDNRQAVHDLTDNLKTALKQRLEETPWFDEATKQYAKEKLDLVNFKMGFPDWMANHDTVDQEYIGMNINVSDFFQNLLSGNRYHRDLWSRELREGENREEWMYNTYDTNVAVLWAWNEIIAPAGILQSPVYDSSIPHYTTFGSLGSLLARFLHHIVDDWGEHYDKFGNYIEGGGSFWSNSSIQKYKTAKVCVDQLYINASQTFVYPNGLPYPVAINPKRNTPRAIAITSGVRLALEGYDIWTKARGLAEKMLPGLSLTNHQMLMLSWAQSYCSNRDVYSSFHYAYKGNVEEELLVNTVLGELKEFSDAFQCRKGDQMFHEDRCNYY